MQKFTTKQLLKILPIDEKMRLDILAKYDSLTEDQKYNIQKLCWLMFFELYTDKVQHEFQKTLLAIKDKKGKLKGNLYQQVEEKVYQEMRKILVEGAEKERVGKVREELKKHLRQPN